MKKLSLKNLKLGVDEMLQRNELKSVFGGYGGSSAEGSCAIKCASGVWIHNCPDVSPSTQEWACTNQGGPSGSWQCTG